MYLTSELLLKQLLLCWGAVKSIVPPTQKEYVDAYLAGRIPTETNLALDRYRDIYDAAGEKIIDFLVIENSERLAASDHMRELLTKWNADSHFYDSLKIRSIDDLMGKWVEWYWFLHEKLEQPLVELMLKERLVVNWAPGEIVGLQEIGKSYMSVIADELQRSRNIRLITDDEYYLAARAHLCSTAVNARPRAAATNSYHLPSRRFSLTGPSWTACPGGRSSHLGGTCSRSPSHSTARSNGTSRESMNSLQEGELSASLHETCRT
jgi:hypothetical protein